jgi:hypothetical protein
MQIFGDSLSAFLSSIFFCLIGFTISLLLSTTSRDVNSDRTPAHFDFVFFIKDNWKRFVLNTLLIYVAVRFYGDIVGGAPLTPFVALSMGIGFDRIVSLIKSKTQLLDTKDKKTE